MKNAIINKVRSDCSCNRMFVLFSCVTNVSDRSNRKRNPQCIRHLPVLRWLFQVMFTSPREVLRKWKSRLIKSTMDIIITEVNGNTLVLKTKDGHWRDLGEINVYITMPEIDELSVIRIR